MKSKDVLYNDRIMAGAEFEMVFPDFSVRHAEDIYIVTNRMDSVFEYEIYNEGLLEYKKGQRESFPFLPEYAKKLGYKRGDEIPDPLAFFNITEEDIFKVRVKEFFKYDFFPFKGLVKNHTLFKNKHKWIIKPDTTLGDDGLEVVSPVMPLPDLIKVMPIILDHINTYGETCDRCGLHINLSIDGLTKDTCNLHKLVEFIDEKYIYKNFPSRVNNKHCRSSKNALMNGCDIRKYQKTKEMAVNIMPLYKKENPYIEFRYIGGKDYHKNFEIIKKIIAMYGESVIQSLNKK